jgi:hypothetical protein
MQIFLIGGRCWHAACPFKVTFEERHRGTEREVEIPSRLAKGDHLQQEWSICTL